MAGCGGLARRVTVNMSANVSPITHRLRPGPPTAKSCLNYGELNVTSKEDKELGGWLDPTASWESPTSSLLIFSLDTVPTVWFFFHQSWKQRCVRISCKMQNEGTPSVRLLLRCPLSGVSSHLVLA